MSNDEQSKQAQNLINDLNKITKDIGTNRFTVDSAAKAKYELSVFRQNLSKYTQQFGRNDEIAKQLESLAKKAEGQLKSNSPLSYI